MSRPADGLQRGGCLETDKYQHETVRDSKRPHHDLHAAAWPQLFDGGPRVAVQAGPGPVDDGDGDVGLQLVHPVDHGPLGPAVGDGHVPEGRLAAATGQGDRVRGWLQKRLRREGLRGLRSDLGLCTFMW